jgi:DNA invertase Pin-like site-specific DNA recombinase
MYRKFAMGQYQIEKGNEASARIHEAIVALLQEERLPSGTAERAQAIAERGKVSQATLYKKHNILLWHPRYTSFEMLMSE